MSRRPPVALALLALLAGCTGGSGSGLRPAGVTVAPVNGLATSTLIRCNRLKAALPQELSQGVASREVTPVSDTTAAWGDPVISLRCGVPAGSERDDPYTFNGVPWALHDSGASRTWTTLGRKVNVEVVVPDAYSSQAELVGSVSFAVAKAL